MIAHFKVQVDDKQRRAIAHHRGKTGFATRRDVVAELEHLFAAFMEKLPPAPERKKRGVSGKATMPHIPEEERCSIWSREGDHCLLLKCHSGEHVGDRPDGQGVVWSNASSRVWRS